MIPALLPLHVRADVSFERGEGAYLFDASGRRYLDFLCGIGVTGLGHAHPHLVETLIEQAGKVWHVSNLYRIPGQERLACHAPVGMALEAKERPGAGSPALSSASWRRHG